MVWAFVLDMLFSAENRFAFCYNTGVCESQRRVKVCGLPWEFRVHIQTYICIDIYIDT